MTVFITRLAFVAIFLFGAGCTWDLSRYRPYSDYVGKIITLKQDTEIGKIQIGIFPRYNLDFAGEFQSHGSLEELIAIPSGTPIRITKVVGHTFKGWGVSAKGIVTIPETGRRITWHYGWGYGGSPDDGQLYVAPWEDVHTTPKTRRLTDHGRQVVDHQQDP